MLSAPLLQIEPKSYTDTSFPTSYYLTFFQKLTVNGSFRISQFMVVVIDCSQPYSYIFPFFTNENLQIQVVVFLAHVVQIESIL